MDPKLFAQMNKMMGGKFDNMDEEQIKQAGNIWKMLDDMAENNPQGYKSFVDSNIKEGFQELKKEKEEKIKEQKVVPNVGFLIKTQANLKVQILNKEEIPIYQKLNVKENNIADYQNFKAKCDKEVKFYINVMYHSRVKGPLNADMKPVDKFEDVKSWKIVPVSVCQVASKKSESYGTNVYFVDTVLNDKVYNFMNSQLGLQVSLIQFVTDRVQEQIKLGFNPLMESYNPADVNELLYYEFEKMSLKRHTKKKYKPADQKQFNENKVQAILIEPKYDNEIEKFQENSDSQEKDQKENIDLNNPEALLKQYKEMAGNDDNDNNTSNNSNNNNSKQGIPQKQEEKVLDGLKLISKSEQEAKLESQQKKVKKPLIQELSSTVNEEEEEDQQNQQKQQQQQQQQQQKQQQQKQQNQQQEQNKQQQQQNQQQQQQQQILSDVEIEEKVKLKQKIEAEKLIQQNQKLLEQKIQKPKFELIESPQSIVIEIELPLVKSFKQINLDISSSELKLDVVDVYDLQIKFSENINNDALKAKWDKKSKVLKLNLPKFY